MVSRHLQVLHFLEEQGPQDLACDLQAGTRPSHRDGSCCFELLGYDIMVDRNYRAWLVEVNHSPSFSIDTPLDASIKTALIVNTLKMVRPARPYMTPLVLEHLLFRKSVSKTNASLPPQGN